MRRWKRGASFLCALTFIFGILSAVPSAEARITLTPEQEQQIGWGKINRAPIAYQRSNSVLATIQDTLIRANKDRLVAYTDDQHRGLRDPHLLVTNRSIVNAYSVPGGHIFVSDALIPAFLSYQFDPATGVCSGAQKEGQFGNLYELYGHSAIAAAIAHEDVHWERNFLQREVNLIASLINRPVEDDLKLKLKVADGQGFDRELDTIGLMDENYQKTKDFVYQEEYDADKNALTLLDNTESFSPGSLMTIATRMYDKEGVGKKSLPHPKAEVRRQIAIDHIKKISHGRVELDQQGRMKLDGKLFMGKGYLPARDDVTAYDRTSYVAGELAKSVSFGANHITAATDSNAYRQSGGMYLVTAVNRSTNKHIVIDKFDISQYDASALESGKESSHSDEMKAAKEIKKFLEKNSAR